MEKKKNDGVGYGRPPTAHQFKAGKSGNPKGRPKGSRNFATDFKRMLDMTVPVERNGKRRQVSTQEALLLRVREMGLRGDARALERILAFAMKYSTEVEVEHEDEAEALEVEDQAILDGYRDACRREDAAARDSDPKKPDDRDKQGAEK